MLTEKQIRDKCFVNRRFIQSVKELKRRNCDFIFNDLLKEVFEEIIKIAENFDKITIFRSKTYINYFNEETGLTLEKGNPFCFALFSKTLSINVIFILLKECKECGYIPLLTRGEAGLEENHTVCAFDLFDLSRNESLFKIKKKCG